MVTSFCRLELHIQSAKRLFCASCAWTTLLFLVLAGLSHGVYLLKLGTQSVEKYIYIYIYIYTCILYIMLMRYIYNTAALGWYSAKLPWTAVILYIYRISMVYMIYFRIRFFATGHTRRAPFWVFLRMRRMPLHIVTSISQGKVVERTSLFIYLDLWLKTSKQTPTAKKRNVFLCLYVIDQKKATKAAESDS